MFVNTAPFRFDIQAAIRSGNEPEPASITLGASTDLVEIPEPGIKDTDTFLTARFMPAVFLRPKRSEKGVAILSAGARSKAKRLAVPGWPDKKKPESGAKTPMPRKRNERHKRLT